MRTKAELERLRSRWEHELQKAAKKLGYEPSFHGHQNTTRPVLKVMGPLAWGRHDYETRPGETKDHVAQGVGYLNGCRNMLMRMAKELGDDEAARIFVNVHPV